MVSSALSSVAARIGLTLFLLTLCKLKLDATENELVTEHFQVSALVKLFLSEAVMVGTKFVCFVQEFSFKVAILTVFPRSRFFV